MRLATALFALSVLFFAAPGPARAVCTAEGLINTCLDDDDIDAEVGAEDVGAEEEAYERLDGGSYGGRPAETATGKTITVGGTTVTLSQSKDEDQPWQPFNRQFADGEKAGPGEDRPRESGNPMQFKCYADGCY